MGMLGIDDLATVQQLAAAVADKVTSTQLSEGLAGKSNTGHGHSISDVSGLQNELDGKVTSTQLSEGLAGKSNTGHGHSISDVSGLQNALDGKVSLQTATTGTLITFTAQKVFGSVITPETGDIDNDLTGANPGIVQKIYHSHSTAPTFPAGWVKLGSGTYTAGVLNIIFCEWVGASRAEYWVTQ